MTILREWVERLRTRLAGRHPDAALARAQALLRRGDAAGAVPLLGRAARAGVPAAAYELGLCYLAGTAVPRDMAQAARWLEVAARQGFVPAQVKLAGLLVYGVPGGSDAGSGIFASRAAETVQDFARAAYWARLAADSGSGEAMALLAFISSRNQNAAEARLWYARAAAAGVPHGQLGYGLALLEQAQTPQDAEAALAEIAKAAAAGLAQAHDCLGTLYADGAALVAKDPALALTHYRAAAQAGISHAMACYGLALLDGEGVERDEHAGETWLRRAALAGEAEAALRLGKLYAAQDRALPPNYMEAARWFRLGAEAGSAEAANAMGKLYLLGRGVPEDRAEALSWFIRAKAGAGGGS